MKTIKMFIVLLVGLPMLMMVGCKKENPNSSNMRFYLTDAPGDFEAVIVDIKGVEVKSETAGWVMLESNLGKINLLDYMNGKTILMAEGRVDAGKITQARLILGNENTVVVDGKSVALQTPSGMQSGLKINLNNQLEAGGSYEWTIDFDAAQSVVATGTGSFILKPVLRLIVDAKSGADINANTTADIEASTGINTGTTGEINLGGGTSSTNGSTNVDATVTGGTVVVANQAGNIAGKVSSTIGLATVYATNASGAVTSTVTGIDGSFKIIALKEGNYTIKIDPALPLLSAKIMSNIKVAAEQTTELGVISM